MLVNTSKKTGLNILVGAGDYSSFVWNDEMKRRSVEDIKDQILNEFKNGIGELKIKPGLIGEIGIWDFGDELEIKSLKSASRAQRIVNSGVNMICPLEGSPRGGF